MTTETELKRRISQMDDEGLRKMINNHFDYQQAAIDLATEELRRRDIPFDPPQPSDSRAEEQVESEDKKGKLKFLIFRLAIAAVLLFFAAHAIFAETASFGNLLSAGLMILLSLLLIVGQKGLVYLERLLNSLGIGGSNDSPEDP